MANHTPRAHTRTELLEAVADGTAGFGLLFMSFLGTIPGLLPMVALLLLAGVILVIPALVAGVVFGLPVLLGRIVVRSLSGRRRARSERPDVATAAAVRPERHERPAYTPPATRNTAPVA